MPFGPFTALPDPLPAASADRTLRAWDVPAQRCVGIAEGHSRPVLCLAVSDRMVFSGSYDACIKAWDRGRMGLVRDMAGHSDAVSLVERGGAGRVTSRPAAHPPSRTPLAFPPGAVLAGPPRAPL